MEEPCEEGAKREQKGSLGLDVLADIRGRTSRPQSFGQALQTLEDSLHFGADVYDRVQKSFKVSLRNPPPRGPRIEKV